VKLFFDSNVLVAGLIARGLCADLVLLATSLYDLGQARAIYSPVVEAEAIRILRDKLRVSDQDLEKARRFFAAIECVAEAEWQAPETFPDSSDAPIVGAALAAGADWFVTGDKALLALGQVEGLPIVSPRTAYLRLRGLG